MNTSMQRYTRRLFIRGVWAIVSAALVWGGGAVLLRYNQALEQGIADRKRVRDTMLTLRQRSERMRSASSFLQQHAEGGAESVPAGLYRRVDQIKQLLHPAEFKVASLENKPEGQSIKFSMKLSATDSYQQSLNHVGELEAEVFPFVVIRSLGLQRSASELQQTLMLSVEGEVFSPATSSDAAMPKRGGKHP